MSDDRRHRSQRDLRRALSALVDVADHAVPLGQAMLVVVGVIVSTTAPLLHPSPQAWIALALVGVVMIGVVLASTLIDRSRLHPRATLIYPAAVFAAMAVLGEVAPNTFSPLTGVLVFAFAYIGLTQSPGTSLVAAPFAVGCYLVNNTPLVPAILVRLLVAVMVWIFLAELLAQLTLHRHVLTAALEKAAHSDVLTGVANRRDWDERLAAAAPGTAVVVCDLDHFKSINDTHGHQHGDQVLAAFGTLLTSSLRAGDYCARYGGEEFALLLHDAAVEDATAIVARLHHTWSQVRPDVTFSAGLAICRSGRGNAATFQAADAALYAAKNGGRDTDRVETPCAVLESRIVA